MIEWIGDSAEVTKFEQHREPKDVQTLERNLRDIAEGTYGRPPVEYPKHAGNERNASPSCNHDLYSRTLEA